MAEADAEVPGGSVAVAAAVVNVAAADSGVVMGVTTVDVSVRDGVEVPVWKAPRKLPAAMEMPRSNRRTCMPSTEAFSKSGAISSLSEMA